MTHHHLSTDFVVIGGGMAGVCAAIAAARLGRQVVLVQNRSVLGGAASSEVRMHIVGADCEGHRPGARESGLLEELRLTDACRNPHRSFSQWDLLLYEKVISEPNIRLFLDTSCEACETIDTPVGRRIKSVRVVRHSTEEEFTINASFFADCSGDGRLGKEAGADFVIGREARDQYGEPLALPVADRKTLGASILFTARQYPTPQPFEAPAWARQFKQEDFHKRDIRSYEYGYWWAEWGGQLDMIKDETTIRHELLRIALGVWNYVKNSGNHPDSANWALEWVGAIPAKRESRRFLGPHVLTQNDVQSGTIFQDQVAYGGWWIDLHPPSGVDAVEEPPCVHAPVPHLFSIPLRCLYSRNITNLFFAGRNISATHVGFATTRVMGTCSVMGQAIGTAAAMAEPSASIAGFYDEAAVARLQQQLLKNDAFLLGITAQDPNDMAHSATIEASSQDTGADCRNIVDGITRELPAHFGKWADDKTHCWESHTVPAWIELTWPTTRVISEIHLTFDSGFQRELKLSPSDHHSKKTIRGPQPELARDYSLLLDGNNVLSITGNYLRKRVHLLKTPVTAKSLRIEIATTNGAPKARLFEVRVY
ncbi:FAD-dependent oxidoreductase [Termitidicoccus mucosus]|uniref:NAD/FAD-utilizing enzyme apparently involved in cell division n=1 Tax=Termitidicoccus mucosus TaxID=1184151 RepID=A0A178IQX3_9BACT|nr:NAD/FAD-utilizing enzyme apparently involved in cell division [Opitutaceae bacterium TSB47]